MMKQSAQERPDPTYQRKAAIARGAALEHTGRVEVSPMAQFDLNRTIFQTLEGKLARFVMTTRVAKDVRWNDKAAQEVQADYDRVSQSRALPPVAPELMRFLVEECDFDVEHADGSFLDHLYFCYEYTGQHYPKQSALVMLLHSILGTGTNTFAMKAEKIPQLQPLMTPAEWAQVEAFPSVLRLLYAGKLRQELRENLHRPDALKSIKMHRVIDNHPIEMSGEDLWVALNFQLIHLVDFLPVANWAMHQNDTAFIVFRDLYDLMEKAGKREAHIEYSPTTGPRELKGERMSTLGRLTTLLPVGTSEKMAAKSVQKFSERIGHSLEYQIRWE